MHDTSKTTASNQPDAVNPAIAPRFQGGRQWRGVTDPHRSKQTSMIEYHQSSGQHSQASSVAFSASGSPHGMETHAGAVVFFSTRHGSREGNASVDWGRDRNRIGSRGVPDASDSVSVRHDSVRRKRKRSDQTARFRKKENGVRTNEWRQPR